MTQIFDLSGQVAIVTGGNGGIGLGMAEALVGAGCGSAAAAGLLRPVLGGGRVEPRQLPGNACEGKVSASQLSSALALRNVSPVFDAYCVSTYLSGV